MITRAHLQAALKTANVGAFLKAIRLGEGTSDEEGYYRIVGGRMFTDDSRHPNVMVYIKRYDVHSSASGAYQFIRRTWLAVQKQYGLPDFSPSSQDEGAVGLIANRQALVDVLVGMFPEAVKKCSAEWASLPGSTAGQRIESYEKVVQVYLDAGGTLA